MENGKNTANDSDYCPQCKVKIMDGTCFCDWPANEDVENEKRKAEQLLGQQEGEAQSFRDKIKSITFNRVKGGARR